MKQLTLTFAIGQNNMELSVTYDRKEPENYTVVSALHNGKDVTDFYVFADDNGEGLFYPQIVGAIAHDICTQRIESGIWGVSALVTPVAA